jgi:hypothetical protein
MAETMREKFAQTPLQNLARIFAAQAAPEAELGPPHVRSGLEFQRWRVVHKHVHGNPYHPDPSLPRSEQWQDLAEHLRGSLGDPEVLAWVAEQAEINAHRERGIPDFRPRKDEPCHDYLLEYVGNRKRTALAIHHFNLAAKEEDPDLDWEVTDAMIRDWRDHRGKKGTPE